MCGFSARSRCGRQVRDASQVPRRFTSIIRSKRLTGVSSVPVRLMADALLTRMSMPPKWATACATAASTASALRTSMTSGRARPPASSISCAAVWMVPGSLGCGWLVLAAMTMLAPSSAARSAIALPMPRLAPVMKSVFPYRLSIGFNSIRWPARAAGVAATGVQAPPAGCRRPPAPRRQADSCASVRAAAGSTGRQCRRASCS
ncbi:MAG: hypothetical protein OZX49_02302 [Immundisolibacter sp.]|nr:hypothetical protein [Immundisolibacter sp.]